DSGDVYFAVVVIGQGGGADQFFKLDTKLGTFFNYLLDFPGKESQDAYLRGQISADNARVFFGADGAPFYIDTATDKVFFALESPSCCYGNYELALSSNQTQFTATFYTYDSNLNNESYYALNDREIQTTQYVYGAKLSGDGRLLFQPSASGIDMFDGNLGNLRARISLPFALSPNYDALVSDGQDSVFVAITGATGDGIAIIDLTSLVEPSVVHRTAVARQHFVSSSRPRGRSIPAKHTELDKPNAFRVPHKTRDWLGAKSSTTPYPDE